MNFIGQNEESSSASCGFFVPFPFLNYPIYYLYIQCIHRCQSRRQCVKSIKLENSTKFIRGSLEWQKHSFNAFVRNIRICHARKKPIFISFCTWVHCWSQCNIQIFLLSYGIEGWFQMQKCSLFFFSFFLYYKKIEEYVYIIYSFTFFHFIVLKIHISS